MLEVRNLSKIYKSTVKNGVDTKALDNVSLTFPDRGMVFLLGKSGSGKSTLLNVCGGLDSPTSGEIIVKGKSSKNFSQSDFDSYRNTFVGFIFQEYNILNEFSVEDNIALALELQGKPKDKKIIAELLEQVDLSGFAKRKPNTLSGGQKQRIAIARALVKSPEIIMADEPTGALDSATGKQVFDTLKKLSADKLVIVVSHDRDFAELYGDRIIELKDGKILSDVSKTEQQNTALTESITAVDGVLCIKKGASLNENDFAQIKSFLKNSSGDVIIAKDEQDVSAFKKAAHITDSGTKEYFADTDEEKLDIKQYGPNDSKFIRSKLPLRHASKIGISSLKNKPFRLILTIILCTVSFVLFGLLSTLTFYDSEAMFKQTLTDSNREYVTIEKHYLSNVTLYEHGEVIGEYNHSSAATFSEADVTRLSNTFGNNIFGAASSEGMEFNIRSGRSDYWNNYIYTIAYIPENNTFRSKINGSYPEKAGEICISSYSAQMLVELKAADENGNVIDANSTADLIGKTVLISNRPYKIVGIFDCGELDPKYDELKDNTNENYSLLFSLENELADGTYLLSLLSKQEFDEMSKAFRSYSSHMYENNTQIFAEIKVPTNKQEDQNKLEEYPSYRYHNAAKLPNSNITYFDSQKTSLGDTEILLSESSWVSLLYNLYEEKYQNELNDDKFDMENPEDVKARNEKEAEFNKLWNAIDLLLTGTVREYDKETGEEISSRPITAQERTECRALLIKAFGDAQITVSLTLADSSYMKIGDPYTYTVVGITTTSEQNEVFITESEYNKLWNIQYVTFDFCEIADTEYVEDPNAVYSMIYAPFSNTHEQTNILWDIHSDKKFDENSTRLSVGGRYISELDSIDEMVKSMSKVFLYVGLVFALFAILLFSNFISTSISQKRHEIGILRAVGARGNDVFKIFFSESFVIAFICSLFATIATAIICSALNTSLAAEIGASIFVFGPFSIAIVIVTALVTAILATFVPVWLAARKKPVESIRAI